MINFSFDTQWFLAFILNAILVGIAQRVPLLTPRGWIHAGVLGTLLWGCLGWRGWFAVVIYLVLGSLVTRLGFFSKDKVGLAEARGGRRGPENLWGSAATGTFLALLIETNIGSESLLLIGFAASFAAKLADTFGSEIGKLWGRKTYLITSFRSVPPGTDGAISFVGTFASALGSFLMTFTMLSLDIIPSGNISVIICCAGIISTLIESFIGAIAQDRIFWMSNEIVNCLQTSIAAIMSMTLVYYFVW